MDTTESLCAYLNVNNWNTTPFYSNKTVDWTTRSFMFGDCHVFMFQSIVDTPSMFPLLFKHPHIATSLVEELKKHIPVHDYLLYPFLLSVIMKDGIYIVLHHSLREQVEAFFTDRYIVGCFGELHVCALDQRPYKQFSYKEYSSLTDCYPGDFSIC